MKCTTSPEAYVLRGREKDSRLISAFAGSWEVLLRSKMYTLWEELGVVQDKQFINYTYFNHTLDERGNRFISYTDPDKLREHMLSFSQEDEAADNRHHQMTSKSSGIWICPLNMHSRPYYDISDARMFKKYSMPVSELAAQFNNPVLRNLFQMPRLTWHDQSAILLLWTLAWMGSWQRWLSDRGFTDLSHSQ